ncbi:hypothetical protein LTR37_014673 [Vermiconidia calcicola]|uniref:Uncharacterized protein n=1 Tax=Vermiconidia calcicola TaxID=1690605 RepID=A0ACC3MSW6_9PEZI|nr:hypothetical protein LTR37_014673 [Vermiconidia calcicola]
MADLFSIAVGTLSVVEVAKKAVEFLIETQKGTKNTDKDLETLVGDFESLRALCEQVGYAFERDVADHGSAPKKDEEAASKLWRETSGTLKDCETVLVDLEEVAKKMIGSPDSLPLTRRSKDDKASTALAKAEPGP